MTTLIIVIGSIAFLNLFAFCLFSVSSKEERIEEKKIANKMEKQEKKLGETAKIEFYKNNSSNRCSNDEYFRLKLNNDQLNDTIIRLREELEEKNEEIIKLKKKNTLVNVKYRNLNKKYKELCAFQCDSNSQDDIEGIEGVNKDK